MRIVIHHRHELDPATLSALLSCARLLETIVHQQRSLAMKFDEFVASQTAHNTAMGTAIDGLTGDVSTMKADIQKLKDALASADLTDAQQAALDQLDQSSGALVTRAQALDDMTPPPVEEVPAPAPAPAEGGDQPAQ